MYGVNKVTLYQVDAGQHPALKWAIRTATGLFNLTQSSQTPAHDMHDRVPVSQHKYRYVTKCVVAVHIQSFVAMEHGGPTTV